MLLNPIQHGPETIEGHFFYRLVARCSIDNGHRDRLRTFGEFLGVIVQLAPAGQRNIATGFAVLRWQADSRDQTIELQRRFQLDQGDVILRVSEQLHT